MSLGDMAWPEVPSAVLVLPVGSTEQHGPHLPLSTDTDIAVALASRLAARRPGVVVAPAIPYGASWEHAGFAGTLSVDHDTLVSVLVALARSADHFRGIVFVNAHGGNAATVRRAAEALRAEGRHALGWSPLLDGDAHAGRVETSIMLALDPARVSLSLAEAGDTRPLESLMPSLKRGGVASVSPSGVLGDPSGASATLGRELLEAMTAQLLRAFDGWTATA